MVFHAFFLFSTVTINLSGAVPRSRSDKKNVLKTFSKFTGEQPCGSVISIKLHSRASFNKNVLRDCF